MKKTTPIIVTAVVIVVAVATAAALFLGTGGTDIPAVGQVEVVATVNGEPISLEEFRTGYKRFIGRFNLPEYRNAAASPQLRKSFLDRMIETRLLLQEARLRGITVSEDEIKGTVEKLKDDYPKETMGLNQERIAIQLDQWRDNQMERLIIEKLIAREVDSVVHISDEEVRAYYKSHQDDYKQPRMVRARQIVVGTEEEAREIRSQILKGADFAQMAREHSLSPDGAQGGDLGTFARGQMPEEFDDVVFRYRVGSISKVVRSPYGFHIFKVEDKISPRTLSLEEVSDQIAAELFRQRQASFFEEWVSSVKERADIKIFTERLGGA